MLLSDTRMITERHVAWDIGNRDMGETENRDYFKAGNRDRNPGQGSHDHPIKSLLHPQK